MPPAARSAARTSSLYASPPDRIAIIGTGVIGASWAALFAARGFDVVGMVRNEHEAKLFAAAASEAWVRLRARGIAREAAPTRIRHVSSIEECCAGAVYVQESVPENLRLKQQVVAQIDAACPRGVLIGTSSSFLSASLISLSCAVDPSRVVTVHPSLPAWDNFVEVFSSEPSHVARLVDLLDCQLGMDVVPLGRESHGHVLNAMLLSLATTSALLIRSGVCSAAEADRAASHMGKLMYAGGGGSANYVGLIGGGKLDGVVAIATDGYTNVPLGMLGSAVTAVFGHGLLGRALLWLLQLLHAPLSLLEGWLHPMRAIQTYFLSPCLDEYRRLGGGDALCHRILQRVIALDSADNLPPLSD